MTPGPTYSGFAGLGIRRTANGTRGAPLRTLSPIDRIVPGWQIAPIAVGAALVAAVAVVLDRALAAHKVHATTA